MKHFEVALTKSTKFTRMVSKMPFKLHVGIVVVDKAVESILATLSTILLSKIIVSLNPDSGYDMKMLIIATCLVSIIDWAWSGMGHVMTHMIGNKFSNILHNKYIGKLYRCKLNKINSGSAMSHIDSLCSNYTSILVNCLILPCSLVPAVMVIIKLLLGGMGLNILVPILGMVASVAICIFGNKIRYPESKKANAKVVGASVDGIINAKTVRYFHKEDFAVNALRKAQDEAMTLNGRLLRRYTFLSVDSVFMIPVLLSVFMIPESCRLELGTMMLVSTSSLSSVISFMSNIFDMMADAKDDRDALAFLDDIDDRKEKSILKDGLKISKLAFGFRKSDGGFTEFKADGIHIKPGERYVITGKSGEGKSTLANVIAGSIPAMRGSFDPVKTFYCYQESELLDISLRRNITFDNPNISDDEILELLDKLGLSDWVHYELENGLDTVVGERGAKVSSGQKQRINIIRTILKMREQDYDTLIILDEPTSNLDDATEKLAVELFDKECHNTLLVITHRPEISRICSHHIKVKNHVFTQID